MTYDGLIVGLGNPGPKYARTRHNFGFLLADRLVARWAAEPGASCEARGVRAKAEVWDVSENYGARRWLVVKPQTFMNLSGECVQPLAAWHRLLPENILVVHDELDIAPGRMKFKKGGGNAGHNGLKHIAATLGTTNYARLRFGIGNEFPRGGQIDFVLGHFEEEDWKTMDERLKTAGEIIKSFCLAGIDITMNQFNKK